MFIVFEEEIHEMWSISKIIIVTLKFSETWEVEEGKGGINGD